MRINNLIFGKGSAFLIVLMLFSQLVYSQEATKCSTAVFNEISQDIVNNLKQQNVNEDEARELAKAAINEVAGVGLSSLINDVGLILDDESNPNRFSDAAELVTKDNYLVSSELRNALLKAINKKAGRIIAVGVEEEFETPEESLLKTYVSELLQNARKHVLDIVSKSRLKDFITYHGPPHWNELLEFVDAVLPGMKLKNQDKLLELARLAIMYHDTGYYNAVGEKIAVDHEERSKQVLRDAAKDLGLSDKDLQAALFMIELTKFAGKIGPTFKAEVDLMNKAINELREGKELSADVQAFLKQHFSSFDSKNKEDIGFIVEAIQTAKAVAVADLYGQSNDKVALTPGLYLEFKYDSSPATSKTMIAQIGDSYGFLVGFALPQRLSFLLDGDLGIGSSIPKSVKVKREENIAIMKKVNELLKNIEAGKDVDAAKTELNDFINELDSRFVKKEWKQQMISELDIIEQRGRESRGEKQAKPQIEKSEEVKAPEIIKESIVDEEDLEELSEASRPSERVIADGKSFVAAQASLEDIINNPSRRDEALRKVEDFVDASYELMTDHNTAPSLVYERILNALLRGDEKLDLAVINLPITLLNEIDKSLKTGDFVKEKLFERLKKDLDINVQLGKLDGESIGYLGTRIILTGLTKDELSKVTEIFNEVVKDLLAASNPEIKNKLESSKDKINVFVGHTTISGESIKGLTDPASKVIISEGLVVDAIKDAIGAAETVEKNREVIGSNILIFDDVKDETINKLVEKNRNKYVPPFEFSTGKLPRLGHNVGFVKNALKNIATSSAEDLESKVNQAREALRKFYRDSLLDNRFDKTFKKNAMQLIVDWHKSDKRSLEELLKGSQITPGLYVTKLGDEIALLYEVDGKLIITFAELDKFNAFNSLYIPDARDSHYHNIISNVINYAKEFGVSKGISKEKNKEFISGIKKVIEETELSHDEDASLDLKDADDKLISIALSDGRTVSRLKKGDKIKIKDARFHDHEKENGRRVPKYNADESPKLTTLSASVTSDPEKEVNNFDEHFRYLSSINGVQKKKLGRGKTFTADEIEKIIEEELVEKEDVKVREALPETLSLEEIIGKVSINDLISLETGKSINEITKLGEGNFGVVFRVNYKGKDYALKLFKDNMPLEMSIKEFDIGSKLKGIEGVIQYNSKIIHEVKAVGIKEFDGVLVEYIEGDDLRKIFTRLNKMEKGEPLSENEYIPDNYISQLEKTLRDMHDKLINHNDIHEGNVIITKHGFKIIDLGKSELYQNENNPKFKEGKKYDLKDLADLIRILRPLKESLNKAEGDDFKKVLEKELISIISHTEQLITEGAFVQEQKNLILEQSIDMLRVFIKQGKISEQEFNEVVETAKQSVDEEILTLFGIEVSAYSEEDNCSACKWEGVSKKTEKSKTKIKSQEQEMKEWLVDKVRDYNEFGGKELDVDESLKAKKTTEEILKDAVKVDYSPEKDVLDAVIPLKDETSVHEIEKEFEKEFLVSDNDPDKIYKLLNQKYEEINLLEQDLASKKKQLQDVEDAGFFESLWYKITGKLKKLQNEVDTLSKSLEKSKQGKDDLNARAKNNGLTNIINLGLMKSNSQGGMVRLFNAESAGGNAKAYGMYVAAGTNFIFDSKTGEIVYFENPQDIPKEIKKNYNAYGIFRIATDRKGNKRIIEIYFEGQVSEKVKSVIKSSADEYNKRFGIVLEGASNDVKILIGGVEKGAPVAEKLIEKKKSPQSLDDVQSLDELETYLKDRYAQNNPVRDSSGKEILLEKLMTQINEIKKETDKDKLDKRLGAVTRAEGLREKIRKLKENKEEIGEISKPKPAEEMPAIKIEKPTDLIRQARQKEFEEARQEESAENLARTIAFFQELENHRILSGGELLNEEFQDSKRAMIFEKINNYLDDIFRDQDTIEYNNKDYTKLDLLALVKFAMTNINTKRPEPGVFRAYEGEYNELIIPRVRNLRDLYMVLYIEEYSLPKTIGQLIWLQQEIDRKNEELLDIRERFFSNLWNKLTGKEKLIKSQIKELEDTQKNSQEKYKKDREFISLIRGYLDINIKDVKEQQIETYERLNVKFLFGRVADSLNDDQIKDIYDRVVRASNPEQFEIEKEYLKTKYRVDLTQGMPPMIMGGMTREQLEQKIIDVQVNDNSAQVHVEGSYTDEQIGKFEVKLEDNLFNAKAWTKEELDAARKRKDCDQGSISCDISLNNPEKNKDKIQQAAEGALIKIEKPKVTVSMPMLSILPTLSWISNLIGEKLGLIKTAESYDEINLEDIANDVSFEELQEGEGLPLLGEGGSGFVYKVEYKRKPYALKIFRNHVTKENREKELSMAFMVKDIKEFVKYHARVNNKKETIGILEELVKAKSLRELIDNNEVIDDIVVDNIISSLYNAISKAHEKGFIHGDLKELGNVLITADGHVKIADYSWSQKKSEIFGFNKERLNELQALSFLAGHLILLKKSLKYVNDDRVWINEIKNINNNYDDLINLLEQESKYISKEFINDQLKRAKSNKDFMLNKLRLLAEKQEIKNFDELVKKSKEINKIELKSFELSETTKTKVNKIGKLLSASYSEQDSDKALQNINDAEALWLDIEDKIPREMSRTIENDILNARSRSKELVSVYADVENCSECTWPKPGQPAVSVAMRKSKEEVNKIRLAIKSWSEIKIKELTGQNVRAEVNYDDKSDSLKITFTPDIDEKIKKEFENKFESLFFKKSKIKVSEEIKLESIVSEEVKKSLRDNNVLNIRSKEKGNVVLYPDKANLKLKKHKSIDNLFDNEDDILKTPSKSMFKKHVSDEVIIELVKRIIENQPYIKTQKRNDGTVDYVYESSANRLGFPDLNLELRVILSQDLKIRSFYPIKGDDGELVIMEERAPYNQETVDKFGTKFFLAKSFRKEPLPSLGT